MITFVDTEVLMTKDGRIIPKCIFYEDKKYEIDKILDIKRLASTKGGGSAICYFVKIKGYTKKIFLDENKWFIENKDN